MEKRIRHAVNRLKAAFGEVNYHLNPWAMSRPRGEPSGPVMSRKTALLGLGAVTAVAVAGAVDLGKVLAGDETLQKEHEFTLEELLVPGEIPVQNIVVEM